MTSALLHTLLKRQIKRCFGDITQVPEAAWPLINVVNEAYHQSDIDRLMLERSMELSSEELGKANRGLHDALHALQVAHQGMEQRVEERTRDLETVNEHLRQAQKMEGIGQLAGGVAHDFNNLLTVILGSTELLLSAPDTSGAAHLELEEIRRAAERAAALTQQLLAFSRRQILAPKEVDLNQIVGALEKMLTRLIRENIVLRFDPSPTPAYVYIDPGQLEQVIMNLVLNARDALPTGGEIRLEVARVTRATIDAPLDEIEGTGEYIRLRVIDNGIGMAPDVRDRVFEPFFTTKDVGQGTGLGLASVYGIVRQSNGLISLESQEGAGTTFTLHFPVRQAANQDGTPAAENPHDGRGRETILLVEDESSVRSVVGKLLRRLGYQVIEAATPLEACDIFTRRGNEIDLLLTDVIMPEMHGPALAKRLMASRPDLRVIFTSGYSDLPSSALEFSSPRMGFLSKPVLGTALAAKLREILTAV